MLRWHISAAKLGKLPGVKCCRWRGLSTTLFCCSWRTVALPLLRATSKLSFLLLPASCSLGSVVGSPSNSCTNGSCSMGLAYLLIWRAGSCGAIETIAFLVRERWGKFLPTSILYRKRCYHLEVGLSTFSRNLVLRSYNAVSLWLFYLSRNPTVLYALVFF